MGAEQGSTLRFPEKELPNLCPPPFVLELFAWYHPQSKAQESHLSLGQF